MAGPDGSPRPDGTGQGVALVVAAAFVTQTGAAIAVGLFDEVGALGAVFLYWRWPRCCCAPSCARHCVP